MRLLFFFSLSRIFLFVSMSVSSFVLPNHLLIEDKSCFFPSFLRLPFITTGIRNHKKNLLSQSDSSFVGRLKITNKLVIWRNRTNSRLNEREKNSFRIFNKCVPFCIIHCKMYNIKEWVVDVCLVFFSLFFPFIRGNYVARSHKCVTG